MKKVINLAVINDFKEMLLVRKKDKWILPGGKPKNVDEKNLQCLKRELKEELPNACFNIGRYYDTFFGVSPNAGNKIQVSVYFGKLISGNISPDLEINKSKFIKDFEKYEVSEVTSKIIKQLRRDNYI